MLRATSADLDAGERLGAGERAHEHMHAVLALEGGEPEVGDHEPLRRAPAVVVLIGLASGRAFPARGDHDVDAGLELADGLGDREGRDHVAG